MDILGGFELVRQRIDRLFQRLPVRARIVLQPGRRHRRVFLHDACEINSIDTMATSSKASASKSTKTGTAKKRAPSAYNVFVSKTMKSLKQDDIKSGRVPNAQANLKKAAALWKKSKASK